MVQIQMFILHKNFTKWAAGCTKTFGAQVKERREVAVKEGNTDSGHSHWAGAEVREGGAQTWPHPLLHALACTPCLSRRKRGHVSDLSPKLVGSWGTSPWLAAEYCIQDT